MTFSYLYCFLCVELVSAVEQVVSFGVAAMMTCAVCVIFVLVSFCLPCCASSVVCCASCLVPKHQERQPTHCVSCLLSGGKEGIRTPEALLTLTRFPGGPLQPLEHLSVSLCRLPRFPPSHSKHFAAMLQAFRKLGFSQIGCKSTTFFSFGEKK